MRKFSDTLKASSTKTFGTVRQLISDRKSWYSLSPLIHKFFRYQKFCETKKVPLRKLSALWDNKFPTENRDTLSPLLSISFFDTRIFSKHRRVPLRIFFGTARQKYLETKSWHNSLTQKFLRHPKLVTHWMVPLKKFRHSETLIFWQKIVIFPPLIHKLFRYQKFCETKKCFPMNFSGIVRPKTFDGKTWYLPFHP